MTEKGQFHIFTISSQDTKLHAVTLDATLSAVLAVLRACLPENHQYWILTFIFLRREGQPKRTRATGFKPQESKISLISSSFLSKTPSSHFATCVFKYDLQDKASHGSM